MLNLLCKYILGLENTINVMSAGLKFSWGVPVWLFLLLAVALGAGVLFVYRKEGSWLTPREQYLLSALRLVTWIGVLWLVLRPVLVLDRLVQPRSNLGFLIDTSESMDFKDTGAPQEHFNTLARALGANASDARLKDITRAKTLNELFNRNESGLQNVLPERYSVRYFGFDADLYEIEPQKLRDKDGRFVMPEAKGKITQLGQALRAAEARLKGAPLAGLVVFSDGASNRGEAPQVSAKKLGERNIPVFTVGFGGTESLDVEVVDCNMPDMIFKDDELAVRVDFNAAAGLGKRADVRVKLGDKTVGKEAVDLQDGRFSKEITIKAEEKGDHTLTVEVDPLPGEAFTENNRIQKRVRVIDDAIRILIAIDTPSWEYRYLKGFLNSDKRIQTKVFINSGDMRRSRSDDQFVERFPDYADLRKDYDCVILNNITAEELTTRKIDDIRKYVAEDGGALIVISAPKGTPGSFAGTALEQMLPVSFTRISEDEAQDLVPGVAQPFNFTLTREGQYHVVTRLTPKQEDNQKVWAELPGSLWYYQGIRRLKPTAVSLADHATARNEYGRIPLIAFQRFGKGQVLFLGTNSIWRWRYRVGNRYTNRFWGQTIQFMGLPHRLGHLKEVQFQMQGRDFLEGEQIPLTLSVVTKDYVPLLAEKVTVVAEETTTKEKQEFEIKSAEGKTGLFAGNLVLHKGSWRLFALGKADQGDVVVDIRESRLEYEKPVMQKKALEEVAVNSGGKFVPLDETGKIVEYLQTLSKPSRERSEIPLWDFWLIFLLVVGTSSAEWVLRKYKDLP